MLNYARWDDITLVGYELPAPARWTPGDEIPLTLYWQPLKATDAPHALFISLITAEGEALATIDSFPGWGALPTTCLRCERHTPSPVPFPSKLGKGSLAQRDARYFAWAAA